MPALTTKRLGSRSPAGVGQAGRRKDLLAARSHALRHLLLVLALLPLALACDPNEVLAPNPGVADLVGRWDATTLQFVDPDGLEPPIDALAQGVTFFLNIEPSGTYTAIATGSGLAATEIGILTYQDGTLTLTREFPSASVSEAEVILSGDTMEITGGSVLSSVPAGTSEIIIEMTLTRQ